MKSTSDKRILRSKTWLVIVGMNMLALLFVSASSSAAPFNDIPEAVNEALFEGANLYAAKMILAGAILLSAILAMGMAKLGLVPMIFMILVLVGILTAIGWLDYWILVLGAIIVAIMFAGKVTETLDRSSGGS